jgi:hypothetical protein
MRQIECGLSPKWGSQFVETVTGRPIPENENPTARTGVRVYARNKEALVKTRASRGIADGYAAVQPLDVSSARVSPAIIALRHNSRDKAIVICRDRIVKTEGEFGPGIRLSGLARLVPVKSRGQHDPLVQIHSVPCFDRALRQRSGSWQVQ